MTISTTPHSRAIAIALALGMITALGATRALAEPITDANVAAAVAAAKTVEDHQALAAYFTAKSKEALETAATHKTMAKSLGGGKQAGSWEAHCHSLIRTYEAQAKDYTALAKEQAALAKGMQMQPGK